MNAETKPSVQTESKTPESTGLAVTSAGLPSYFDEFEQWFDELRRDWLQPRLFGRHWPELPVAFSGRMPRVDVIDRDEEFLVRAELPGVSRENLDLSLQENIVILRATAQAEEKEEKGQYFRRETSRGEFQRVIRLPGPVDSDKARAAFKDGVLELTLPKAAGAKRTAIPVE